MIAERKRRWDLSILAAYPSSVATTTMGRENTEKKFPLLFVPLDRTQEIGKERKKEKRKRSADLLELNSQLFPFIISGHLWSVLLVRLIS